MAGLNGAIQLVQVWRMPRTVSPATPALTTSKQPDVKSSLAIRRETQPVRFVETEGFRSAECHHPCAFAGRFQRHGAATKTEFVQTPFLETPVGFSTHACISLKHEISSAIGFAEQGHTQTYAVLDSRCKLGGGQHGDK